MEDVIENINLEDVDEALLDDEEDVFGEVDVDDEEDDDVLIESYDDNDEDF